jgi:hypothetical protein
MSEAQGAFDGAVLLVLIVAGVLTCILGVVALVLLRRAILGNMATSSGQPAAALPERPRRAGAAPLAAMVDTRPADAGLSDHILLRVATAHLAAGLAFATLAAVILMTMSSLELLPLRTAIIIWSLAWPTVMVLSLLAGPDRRMQGLIVLGYAGVLLVFCVLTWAVDTPALEFAGLLVPGFFQPVIVWLLHASPSLFLLLFLNRTIRAIGPLVLLFVFVLLLGTQIAISILAVPSVLDATARAGVLLGLDGYQLFAGVAAIGTLAASWPAWRIVAFLRDRYAVKRTSELMLTIGAIWLLQAIALASALFHTWGLVGVAAALAPFAAWRIALHIGLRPALAAARTRPPSRLLLLRVFGFGRRSRRLLDLLGTRWRLIGSIDLIAAPDLASRTIEPSTFLEFVRGRLASLFIRAPAQLDERMAALDRRPDPDARFRINQLFCSDDMWREGVKRLMADASLVVMDLRGFTPDRRGCIYELQTLLDTVPLSRLVFLFDRTTHRRALETVLGEHWQRLDVNSPNLALRDPVLRLIDANDGETKVVRRLLAIAQAPTRPTLKRVP